MVDKIIRYSIIGIAFFLPLSSGAVNSLIGIGIFLWLFKIISRKEIKLKQTGLNLPLFLFFVISCVSIFNSIEIRTSLQGLVKVLKYLGIYFLMVENIDDLKQVKNIITALILGAVIVCCDGVIQYIIGKDLFHSYPLIINVGLKRMTAGYRHCNDFGAYLVTVVGVMWTLALYEFKKRAKVLTLFAALLVTACIALTFSRGAAVAFYGAALLIGIAKRDKLVLTILIALLVTAPFLIPSGAREWIKTTHSPLEAFCNSDRIVFYKSSIQMIKAHPFIGVGINTFSEAYPKYKVPDVDVITGEHCYAHNNYLQMAGEIGLVGLAIFFWILAALFLELKGIIRNNKDKEGEIGEYKGKEGEIGEYKGKEEKIREYKEKKGEDKGRERGCKGYIRNVALGLGCGVLAFLLNGLTESSFYFSKIVVMFWFVAGLGVSLKFIRNNYNMSS